MIKLDDDYSRNVAAVKGGPFWTTFGPQVILHNGYAFGTLTQILLLAGVLLVTDYFYTVVLLLLLK